MGNSNLVYILSADYGASQSEVQSTDVNMLRALALDHSNHAAIPPDFVLRDYHGKIVATLDADDDEWKDHRKD